MRRFGINRRFSSFRARLALLPALAIVGLALGLAAPATSSTTVIIRTVTSTADSGPGTLRQALAIATPGDLINITATGTITLTSGELTIDKSLVINGPGTGRLTISGGNASRIFNISSGNVMISNLTLSGGRAAGATGQTGSNGTVEFPAGGPGGPGGDARGGAIINAGLLNLTRVALSGNSAVGGNGGNGGDAHFDPVNPTFALSGSGGTGGMAQGGAIYSTGGLQLAEVTLSGNSAAGGHGGSSPNSSMPGMGGMSGNGGAGQGGAVYSTGPVTIVGTTFGSNTATGGSTGSNNFMFPSFPGSAQGGAVFQAGSLQITNATFNANITTSGSNAMAMTNSSQGGAIMAQTGPVTLLNSTISGNMANAGTGVGVADGGGIYSSEPVLNATNCIIAGNVAGTNPNTNVNPALPINNLIGGDPKLGPLQDNGGPTHTMALLAGSPAIDAGDNNAAPATDQRGVSRPQNNVADIGAFEFTLNANISGVIRDAAGAPIAGVSVSRGTGTTPVVTDSSGNYTFTDVPPGPHTLTPTRNGYGFSPSSRTITSIGTNITGQNFTGYTTTVIGRVAFSNGVGIGNVQVRLNNGRNTTTNNAGYYTFAGVAPGGYTVTPVLTGYSFAPALRSLSVTTTNIANINFTGGFAINGRIANSQGTGIQGLRVYRTGSSTPAITNSAGYYAFYGVTNGTYTLTPDATQGYGYTPATRNAVVNGATLNTQNFTATTGFNISGRIMLSNGVAISGVTVTRTGGATAVTNNAGYYTFYGVANGTYTLTPSKSGYTFTPVNKNITVNGANLANQNFIGSGP